MVKIKQENVQAALEMYDKRLAQLGEQLFKLEQQYEKNINRIQAEIGEITEAMNILASLNTTI